MGSSGRAFVSYVTMGNLLNCLAFSFIIWKMEMIITLQGGVLRTDETALSQCLMHREHTVNTTIATITTIIIINNNSPTFDKEAKRTYITCPRSSANKWQSIGHCHTRAHVPSLIRDFIAWARNIKLLWVLVVSRTKWEYYCLSLLLHRAVI